jgi:hypothetical protein
MNNDCSYKTTCKPILSGLAGGRVDRTEPIWATKTVKKNTPSSISSNNKIPEKLVDGHKMAGAISVSAKTLQRLRMDGIIGFYRIGRTIRYDVTEVMEALADYHVMSRAQQARPKAISPR